MKVTNEKTENHQAFLTIEMESSEVEESLDKAYHRLVQRTRVPGFRKGKAPRNVLERYVGRESLLDEALHHLVPDAYEQALKEQELESIAQPQIEIEQTDPLLFKAVVPLKPEVKVGDYHGVRLTPEPVEVTGDKVDAVMEQLRHQYATWEPVERPVDFGDLLVMDVWSNVENKPLINQKGAQFQVLRDAVYPVPGFSEQLAGMKKDEEKEFRLQLPAEHPDKELAGKEASFKVRVNEIKQEVLPELNDDFARQVDPGIETLEALRARALSDLKLRAEEQTRIDFENRVIDAVVGLSAVAFPPIMVAAETNRMLNQRFQRGQQELVAYLKNINKTEDELRDELSPAATKNVISSLVLGEVTRQEKIEIVDADIDAEIERMTAGVKEDKKGELKRALNTPQVRASIGQTLMGRKTVQRLTDIAGGTKPDDTEKKEAKND